MATALKYAGGGDGGDNARQKPWQHPSVRWILSLLSVATAAWLVELLGGKAEPAPNAIFFCAIIFSAWFGGQGPGVVATLLSTAAIICSQGPSLHHGILSLGQLLTRLLFLATGLLVSWLTGRQHRAEAALRALSAALEEKVAARTLELRTANEELCRSEAELRSVIDCIPAIAWTAQADGSRVFQNKRWIEYTGLSAEAASGTGWQAALHPEDAPRYLENRRKAIAAGQPLEDEVRFRRGSDGQYRWFLVRAVPLRDNQERIVRWYGVLTDMEDRKQAEENLRQRTAELAHVARVTTLGEMAASIAHEVNQPLTAIVNNANASLNLLADGLQNLGEVRMALAEIAQDGQRGGEVIERIRALVKKSPPRMTLCDLRSVVNDVTAMAQLESTDRGVSVKTELAEPLPLVRGDAILLQQILLNLVMNGMEAMAQVERSARELEISCRRETRDGKGGVIIRVRDHGVGFKPGDTARLFDAFYSTKPAGLGMGLAISRSLVESHGGQLWAAAPDGPGATFAFWLPAGETAVP